MALSLKTHINKRSQRGDGSAVLASTNPYLRLAQQTEDGEASEIVFAQRGQFFYEGGDAIPKDDIPDWVAPMLCTMTRECLREVGLDPDKYPEPEAKPKAARTAKKTDTQITNKFAPPDTKKT